MNFFMLSLFLTFTVKPDQTLGNPINEKDGKQHIRTVTDVYEYQTVNNMVAMSAPRPEVLFRDDEDEEETKRPLIPWSTPRIHDFLSGITGIVQGLAKVNPEKLLEGSFEFIPPKVRPGVKGVLSSIAGRPVAVSEAELTTTPKTTKAPKTTTISNESEEGEEEEVN